MAPRSNSLPLNDPNPMVVRPPLSLVGGTNSEPNNDTGVSFQDGAMKIDHPDGSVTIDFDPKPEAAEDETGFYENLAKRMNDADLSSIASDLIDGIQRDEDSRKEWMDTRALGLGLLGAKLEKPRSDVGMTSAPLEGMSTVRHPLLMEATVNFQATARAELLPSTGPVKVRNDAPTPPKEIMMQTTALSQLTDSLQGLDDLSQALETDMNHYLTSIATEYVPDTDRMLFYVGFGGDGFKKVYNCPLRRRPVSESVDAEDLIVSNHSTDLHNSGRITHHIKMRKSVLRRMQLLGAYRDVSLAPPAPPRQNAVDQKKEEISGVRQNQVRPEDLDYDIYETYCELDLDEFAPSKFKGKGLPLPYRVTLEKESRQILDIRRNWKEDDEQCLAKRFFVQFPFIRGIGFYGLGFIHVLGNTTNALTAAWREMLDAGMFACFPGFLYAKGAGRQNSNQFRVAPGTGVGLDVGAQGDIKSSVMPLPYKEPGPAFTAFIQHVEEVGRRLASTGNVNVGEGKQDAPVGTTLALIEQASKVIDSAHKRLHAAQAEEFKLLKERFREDPESFWRHNKNTTVQWKKDQFIEALNKCELVPVADPNNPTSLHRIAKALAIKQLQQGSPDLYDPVAVDMRVLRRIGEDPQGLFRPTPAPPPPDPRMMAVNAKADAEKGKQQILALQTQLKAAELQANTQDKAQERASRERIEQLKIALADKKIEMEKIIHANDLQNENRSAQHEMLMNQQQHQQDLVHDEISAQHEMRGGIIKSAADIEMERENHRAKMERDRIEHDRKLERDREEHELKMQQMREMHEEKVKAARALAKAKPKAKKETS